MRKLLIACLPAAALAAGCATHEPGWTGTGAQPFDQALAECHAQVDVIPVQTEREAALEACMAQKGWTRD